MNERKKPPTQTLTDAITLKTRPLLVSGSDCEIPLAADRVLSTVERLVVQPILECDPAAPSSEISGNSRLPRARLPGSQSPVRSQQVGPGNTCVTGRDLFRESSRDQHLVEVEGVADPSEP